VRCLSCSQGGVGRGTSTLIVKTHQRRTHATDRWQISHQNACGEPRASASGATWVVLLDTWASGAQTIYEERLYGMEQQLRRSTMTCGTRCCVEWQSDLLFQNN